MISRDMRAGMRAAFRAMDHVAWARLQPDQEPVAILCSVGVPIIGIDPDWDQVAEVLAVSHLERCSQEAGWQVKR